MRSADRRMRVCVPWTRNRCVSYRCDEVLAESAALAAASCKRPCAVKMSSASSRTAPKPPSRTVRNGGRAAPRDPRDDDARVGEHMDPDAIEHGKRLRLAAVVIDVHASVGENAVHIAAQQAHLPRAFLQIAGKSGIRHQFPS